MLSNVQLACQACFQQFKRNCNRKLAADAKHSKEPTWDHPLQRGEGATVDGKDEAHEAMV